MDIKDIQGNTIFSTPINRGGLYRKKLMSEDYISLKFSVSSPIHFDRGYHTEYNGKRFEVVDLSYPQYNTSSGGYDYELRLDAYYWKWKNKNLYYDRQNNSEVSWKLTRTPDAHLSIVCSNLATLGYTYNGTPFTFVIDASVDMSAKLIEYNDINIIDALTLIAQTWEAEWWVEDNIIHLGKCEYNTAIDFELGHNVQSMSRSESNDNFATRVYAFGSTRNLPVNYRDNQGVVVEGVVQKRLMLPAGTPYIDAYPNMPQEQAVEGIVVFDDVYPRRIGTMSGVTTKEYTDTIENEDGSTTEKKWNAYRFKDAGLTFSKEYIIPGQELRIVFTSGALNGMDFAVTFNPDGKGEADPDAQLWEIVRSEDYGRDLPDGSLKPVNGDTYILHGFDTSFVSSTYLPAAEQELKQRAEQYVEKSKEDPSVYDCPMNVVDMTLGDIDLNVGDRVRLLNPAYFDGNGRQSRIYGFEKHLDGSQITYTVGNTSKYSRLAQVENEVKEIVYQGNAYSGSGGGGVYVIGRYDKTAATDRNVFSSTRTVQEIQEHALSRLFADIAAGHITFKDGLTSEKVTTDKIESKAFTEGALGSGMTLRRDPATGKSYMEIDELFVRMKAIFRELVIEKISHVGGEIILSPARMKCIRVEELANAYRCYFLSNDGEREIYNEFVVGDQARSQTFNIKPGVYENVSNRYYWRLVVGIGNDYIDLSKTDADTGSDIPIAGEDICQLGNRNNPERRNAIILSTYGSDAPSFKQYSGIDGYSLSGKEVTKFSPKGNKITGDLHVSSGKNVEESIEEVRLTAEQAIAQLVETQDFIAGISDNLEEVKRQADGAIETWFYDPVPTLSNVPASGWTTAELKNVHLGDLYYSKEGKAYRFRLSGGVYSWELITDTDVTKALFNAQKAQDTADGKRTVFVNQPTTDSVYSVGDLWVNATYAPYANDLLRCKTAKAAGAAFSIAHWEKASKYTDDTLANEAMNAAADAIQAAEQVGSNVSDLGSYVDGAFKDGVIDGAEAKAIEKYLNTLNETMSQVEATYNKIYANEYLTGSAKTNLNTAINSLTSARDNLRLSINNAIVDGKTTPAEKADVDSKFVTFNARLKDFQGAVEDANKDIQTNSIGSIQIGGRNLFRNSGQFKSLTNWYNNGGGASIDSSLKYLGYNTLKTTVGNGILGDWYKLENGVEYTYSAMIYADESLGGGAGTPLHWWAGEDNQDQGKINVLKYDTSVVANTWKLCYVTFKLISNADSFKPFIYIGGGSTVFNIAYLKLERGNKATDWTPAPEDVEDKITSTVNTSFDILDDKIKSKVSQTDFDDLGRTVGSLSSEISQVPGQISMVVTETKTYADTAAKNASKRTEVIVDATGLDQNRYYPVTINLYPYTVLYTITVERTLAGSLGLPGWSTHSDGFSVLCRWTSNGSGWGTIPVERVIETFAYAFTNGAIPVGSIGQMKNSSREYIYVRGGSKYNVRVEGDTGVEIILRTSAFTISSQTIDTLTSVVTPVVDLKLRPTTETIKSEFIQTASGFSLFGKEINLTGKVTFSMFASDAQNAIDDKASTGYVDSAQNTAITNARNNIAAQLGYGDYNTMVTKANAGQTIIENGHIRTSLIDTDTLIAKHIDSATGTLGALTMNSGGYIDLPPTFTSRKGRLDGGGLHMVYDGSNSQVIDWYAGVGYFAGKITCDNNGYLNLISGFGVNVNGDGIAGTVNIGTTYWTKVNIGNSGEAITLATNKLKGIPLPVHVYNSMSLPANTDNDIGIDTGMLIITGSGSNSAIYKIRHTYVENGAVLRIVNTTTNNIIFRRSDQVSGGNIRFDNGANNWQLIKYQFCSLVYYGGYWYLPSDWGQ